MLSYNRIDSTVNPISRASREDEELFEERAAVGNEAAPARRSFLRESDEESELNKAELFEKLSGVRGGERDIPEMSEMLKREKYAPSPRTLVYVDPTVSGADAAPDKSNVVAHTTSVAKTKAKIAVAVYIAVVLALAIAIAFTALSVAGTFQSTSELMSQISGQTEAIDALVAELANADEAALTAAAEKLGLSLPNTGNTLMYDLPETRGPQTFDITTNWFDRLCDGICNLFGGN